MDYNQIILELLDRVKTLEKRVDVLEKELSSDGKNGIVSSTKGIGLTEKARNYINEMKHKAKKEGKSEIVLLCNDIQKALGVVNRPAGICMAMYDCMEDNDEVLFAPPSGKSTTVKIKYYIEEDK